MLIYLIKTNVALMLLFGFYKLMFTCDTFFSWRRTALLSIYLIATIVPGLNIAYWVTAHTETQSMASAYAQVILPAVRVSAEPAIAGNWQPIAIWIYTAVAALLALRLIIQLASIIRLAHHCRVETVNGVRIHTLPGNEGPFSFFRLIFLNPSRHNQDELDEILQHELTHSRQYHSVDILLAEFYTILFWFNPFVWLIRREMRINLEFLADHSVLTDGADSKAYQYHLLRLAYNKNVATITNNFNVLPLKQRIKMMNKRRSKEIGKVKYLLFLPLAATLMVTSNIETVARSMERTVADVPVLGNVVKAVAKAGDSMPVTTAEKTLTAQASQPETELSVLPATAEEADLAETENMPVDPTKKVYAVAEEMPRFNGNLNEWLRQNIKYPAAEAAEGIQGRVIVKFVVDENGKPTDSAILRGVNPALDAEALRVVSSMPDWIPGKQDGKNVSVQYVLPISFVPVTVEEKVVPNGENQSKAESKLPVNKVFVDGKEVDKNQLEQIDTKNIKEIRVGKGTRDIYITTKRAKQ